jgi:EAL domain-containing protein (putative c-di-GMP-specific phosphodiesterase class I)
MAMEALVRWHHPKKGIIPPEKFLAVAEETGLIIPLGEQMLRKICEECQVWLSAGLPVPRIAINLSEKEFRNRDLLATVQNILNETRLPPSILELELKETIFVRDSEHTLHILSQLREMSLHLAIDDFGTGYCSLGKLKHMPIQTIKIDRTFIQNICNSNEDAAVTVAIIAMANTLKLDIVAEGIETEAQRDFLQHLGCHIMQGYYFNPPLEPNEVQTLLAGRSDASPRLHSL